MPDSALQRRLNSDTNLSDRAKQAYDILTKEYKLSPQLTTGVLGNLFAESQLNPEAKLQDDTGSANGIAQWRGQRWNDLTSKYGKSPSFEDQVRFLGDEINSKKGDNLFANAWAGSTKGRESFFNSGSVEDSGTAFAKYFERAGEHAKDVKRRTYSRDFSTFMTEVERQREIERELKKRRDIELLKQLERSPIDTSISKDNTDVDSIKQASDLQFLGRSNKQPNRDVFSDTLSVLKNVFN